MILGARYLPQMDGLRLRMGFPQSDHASDTMQYNTKEQTTTVTTANYHSCCVQVPSPYYIGHIYLHGWALLTENIGTYELNLYGSTEKFDDEGLWLHWMLLMLTNLQQLGAFAAVYWQSWTYPISNVSRVYIYIHMHHTHFSSHICICLYISLALSLRTTHWLGSPMITTEVFWQWKLCIADSFYGSHSANKFVHLNLDVSRPEVPIRRSITWST